MFIVVRNPMYRLIALGVSIAIAAIIYFAVIKSNTDTANNAIKASEQQVQQAVNQANKQSGGAVPQGVKDLTSCIAAAGTDTGKIQACSAKFH
jgi:16S rRNA U1498 N3-methylase RsmE